MNEAIYYLGIIFKMIADVLNTKLPYDITLLEMLLAIVSLELGFIVIKKFFNVGINVNESFNQVPKNKIRKDKVNDN